MNAPVKTPLIDRAVLRLSGEEVNPFLQGLISQDIEKLTPINALYALLLTPQGKLLYDFFLVETTQGILVETAAEFVEPFLKRLKLYKLRAKIDIEPMPDWGVGIIYGNLPEAEPGRIMGLGTTDAIGFVDPRLAQLGLRVLTPKDGLAAALNVIEATSGSPEDYQCWRYNHGVLEGGTDFAAESLFPLDANLDILNGIDYKKGCFVGQEVSSRMKRKGVVKKRLWQVKSMQDLPETGSFLKIDDKTIGTLVARSGKLGLAIVRPDRFGGTTPVQVVADGQELHLCLPSYLET